MFFLFQSYSLFCLSILVLNILNFICVSFIFFYLLRTTSCWWSSCYQSRNQFFEKFWFQTFLEVLNYLFRRIFNIIIDKVKTPEKIIHIQLLYFFFWTMPKIKSKNLAFLPKMSFLYKILFIESDPNRREFGFLVNTFRNNTILIIKDDSKSFIKSKAIEYLINQS